MKGVPLANASVARITEDVFPAAGAGPCAGPSLNAYHSTLLAHLLRVRTQPFMSSDVPNRGAYTRACARTARTPIIQNSQNVQPPAEARRAGHGRGWTQVPPAEGRAVGVVAGRP